MLNVKYYFERRTGIPPLPKVRGFLPETG